ncbi:hypothetical protein BD414DRAFT_496070 [Trametes punicea]|nr:hypothetical protein BD414DRAFT_496070 [Trametes punicea]
MPSGALFFLPPGACCEHNGTTDERLAMAGLLIPLDDTVVVCLGRGEAGGSGRPCHVVQITCKADSPNDIDSIATYYLVRHELSELILRIVITHLARPVPSPLIFEGEQYRVHATHAPWSFGKKVVFMWGNELLEVCEDKWTFVFTALLDNPK